MMRPMLLLCALLLCAAAPLGTGDVRVVPGSRQAATAWILPIHGPIDTVTLASIKRRLRQAKDAGIDAVVLELDTPGGDLEATLRILQAIRTDAPTNTIAWIRPFAYSAGVIIALGTREIVTAPGARLGDAAPVSPLGPLPAAERAKLESPLLAEVVDLARRNGYDERLAQAFIAVGAELWLVRENETGEAFFLDESEFLDVFGKAPPRDLLDLSTGGGTDVKGVLAWLGGAMGQDVQEIDGEPMLPPGRARLTSEDASRLTPVGQVVDKSRLLTLTAQQARAWGLSSAEIADEAALAAFLGGATLHRVPETWSEQFARLVMSWPVRIVLIALVIIGFVAEMIAPGTGAFALGGILALLLLIGAPSLAGLSTWWPLIAVFSGLVLIAFELIIAPGSLVAGLAGAVLLLGGLVFAVASPLASGEVQLVHLVQGILLTTGGVLLAAGVLWFLVGPLGLARLAMHRLALQDEAPVQPPAAIGDRTGMHGIALTDMRPAGRVRVGDDVLDAICSGRWIEIGTPVRIVRDGMEVEVEPEE
jgi:membrane-bound serine protease (ClpP class)